MPHSPILPKTEAHAPRGEIAMNAGAGIRDALIVERMKHWLHCSRPYSITNCEKWRARKNFWALVRKHAALAARHGFRETDVF